MNPLRRFFFAGAGDGARWVCVTDPPTGAPIGRILYVPPFAEELNKCRRMAALAARAFALAGWRVVQIDLVGCGDSAGELDGVSWVDWLADIDLAEAESRAGLSADDLTRKPLVLWGVRAGALVLSDWFAQSHCAVRGGEAERGRDVIGGMGDRGGTGGRADVLLWQPVMKGEVQLTQFLRLSQAATFGEGADAEGGGVKALRGKLAAGECIEVAGYRLSAALANTLAQRQCALTNPFFGRVGCFWVGGDATVASMQADDSPDRIGEYRVSGPAFWLSSEVETAPQLIEASCRFLAGLMR